MVSFYHALHKSSRTVRIVHGMHSPAGYEQSTVQTVQGTNSPGTGDVFSHSLTDAGLEHQAYTHKMTLKCK